MRWSIPFIGGAILALGLYLFPFGEDVIISFLLEVANGEYWLAIAYLYCISFGLIIAGFLILKFPHQVMRVIRSPFPYLAVLVIALILGGL